ncbi:MAG: DUF2075 domain-containing protein [Planctomycetes bacterium]|nr:DUF2075 domain-containing protein [Planctomycetota bacterium]
MPEGICANGTSSRAWYHGSIAEFLQTQQVTIVGRLATNSGFVVLPTQNDAWLAQISLLQTHLVGLTGSLFLEFNIPRMGRRIDAVLLVGPVVFVIEFKVGESAFDRVAVDQVWDYALDLKNFHEASHVAPIVPILIATEAMTSAPLELHPDEDKVYRPILVQPADFRDAVDMTLRAVTGEVLDKEQWSRAPYHPTPTIVEAARALYAQHSVEAIARYDAGAQNLRVTSSRIEELVDEARIHGRRVICFVTGVPGAGKTLVGLNVATRRRDVDQPTHAVFLSGNDPLVAVLREALTRDEVERQESLGFRIRKGKVGESVKAFIQNVRHFRDDALLDLGAPAEHVAIFDEAQRAWNLRQTADFMCRKRRRPGFTQSEPEFLISCMDRQPDWAVIVCLVGGGQEINKGEAGIDAWLQAVSARFPHWHMYISSKLTDGEYAAGKALEVVARRPHTYFDNCLHLAVSMRSFRAETVSGFVKALLDCEGQQAREMFVQFRDRYPITVTRDLSLAKRWIRARARGTERFGLVASSKDQRLKPHAIDVRVKVNPVYWFLNDKTDTRSSYYLEDAATEFQVQGLELDWTCVTWDADLRFTGSGWSFHYFRGDRWCKIASIQNQHYLRNAYRVLLTRARQGMVIFVPPGDRTDPTRPPDLYDSTFHYFAELGIPTLP